MVGVVAGGTRAGQGSSSLGAGSDSTVQAGELNGVLRYDLRSIYDTFYGNDIETNPYFGDDSKSLYYDTDSFSNLICKNNLSNIHLSLNVQSLNSKFNDVKELLNNCNAKKMNINSFARNLAITVFGII